MAIAFLFAGQGSQYVGMGKDFYENYSSCRKLMDSLKCDYDIKKLCFEGEQDVLNDTAYAQSSIVATSLMILEAIKEAGIKADACAGLSLGEYSALCYAGAMDWQTTIDIVRQRGILMANALPKGTSGMAAVLGLKAEDILEVCRQLKEKDLILEIANYNCPGQIVITGQQKAIEKANKILMEKGAKRVIMLNVSGAFHSSMLNQAADQLAAVLNKSKIKFPNIPIYHNVNARSITYSSIEDLIEILKQQISHSVLFEQTIQNMIKDGIDTFVEIGPGKTLSSFVRKIDRNVEVYTINSVEDLERIQQKWNK